MHVIDVGKVKQKEYNAMRQSAGLLLTDISKACAKQRAGRAGRICNGFVYRMYSVQQYEAMSEYTIPEIQRVPLTEICLKAKMLSGSSIENLLSKALEPPPKENVHQSIALLKRIGALDSTETMTHLGQHLINMPVDCVYGKMILYAMILQCIDPVITIVSTISTRDPFLMPFGDDEESQKIDSVKIHFADKSFSDHKLYLNIYNAWAKASNKSQFSAQNKIHNSTMVNIDLLRNLLKRHLEMTGFVHDKNHFDELNRNAMNWEITKACLAAGMDPNFCQISNVDGTISSKDENNLGLHTSCILRTARKSNSLLSPDVAKEGIQWLVYDEKIHTRRNALIRTVTAISPIHVILFAGHFNGINLIPISKEQEPEGDIKELINSTECSIFSLDDNFVSFIGNTNEMQLLFQLRKKFANILSRFFENNALENEDFEVLDTLYTVIKEEDDIEKAKKIKSFKLKKNQVDVNDLQHVFGDPNLMWE